jgi:hypothetical protein
MSQVIKLRWKSLVFVLIFEKYKQKLPVWLVLVDVIGLIQAQEKR